MCFLTHLLIFTIISVKMEAQEGSFARQALHVSKLQEFL